MDPEPTAAESVQLHQLDLHEAALGGAYTSINAVYRDTHDRFGVQLRPPFSVPPRDWGPETNLRAAIHARLELIGNLIQEARQELTTIVMLVLPALLQVEKHPGPQARVEYPTRARCR
ncbi:hypothetical protein H9P43_003372 [Blastocladiella emersonii ATCC 22665]|nr:hypothetical protein H9P43_003372 [Blastocladiella emersonii ATCC 22665]